MICKTRRLLSKGSRCAGSRVTHNVKTADGQCRPHCAICMTSIVHGAVHNCRNNTQLTTLSLAKLYSVFSTVMVPSVPGGFPPLVFAIGDVPLISQRHHALVAAPAHDLPLRLAVSNGLIALQHLPLYNVLHLAHLHIQGYTRYTSQVQKNFAGNTICDTALCNIITGHAGSIKQLRRSSPLCQCSLRTVPWRQRTHRAAIMCTVARSELHFWGSKTASKCPTRLIEHEIGTCSAASTVYRAVRKAALTGLPACGPTFMTPEVKPLR